MYELFALIAPVALCATALAVWRLNRTIVAGFGELIDGLRALEDRRGRGGSEWRPR